MKFKPGVANWRLATVGAVLGWYGCSSAPAEVAPDTDGAAELGVSVETTQGLPDSSPQDSADSHLVSADSQLAIASVGDSSPDAPTSIDGTKPSCPSGSGCACQTGDACLSGVCLPATATQGSACAQPCPPSCPAGSTCTAVGGFSACVPAGALPCAPVAEACNGSDDDCNGSIDDGACDDANSCTVDVCMVAKAACVHDLAQDASACSDDNPCTLTDGCLAGACQSGSKKNCDDGIACTYDTCKTLDGTCQPIAMGNGTPCDDGDKCTSPDACQLGLCQSPIATVCNDSKPCTVEVCDPKLGCTYTNLANALPCDDLSLCTTGEACTNGACIGKKKVCVDGLACTTDNCDGATGSCVFTAFIEGAACDDGSKCTQGEVCQTGACSGGEVLTCTDANPCTVEVCEPKTAACVYSAKTAGSSCDDGLPCTTSECINGQCVLVEHTCGCSSATDCGDGNPCTTDSCSAKTCAHTAAPVNTVCSDGNSCTVGDVCVGSLCKSGSAKVCNDGKPCTVDACHALKGCVSLNLPQFSVCDDGDKCTVGQACGGGAKLGQCFGKALPCDDLNTCTSDECDPKVGCKYTPKANCTLTVTFADIAVKVLAPYCSSCHVYTHASLVDKPAPVQGSCGTLKYVVPGVPDESLLLAKIDPSAPLDSACGGKMPKKPPGPGGLDPKLIKLVHDWIVGGAKP